jgi:hypothetical protein
MQPLPKSVAVSETIYRKALRLYPQSYRREFAEQMAQLFRDQCRDAWQAGRSAGLMKLWLRTLPDLGKTCITEQIAAMERNSFMQYLNAKHAPTILLIASLAFALLSFSRFVTPFQGAFMLLITGSSLAMLAKAGIELFRPGSEWLRIIVRTFVLMFFFAVFMPAWAKLKMHAGVVTPVGQDPFGIMVTGCLFINPVVAFLKLGQFLVQRWKH